MRSDTRGLLRMFVWSGVVVLLFFAVLIASVLGGLNREVAVGGGLGVLLVGVLLISRFATRGLLGRGENGGPDTEPGAAPTPGEPSP